MSEITVITKTKLCSPYSLLTEVPQKNPMNMDPTIKKTKISFYEKVIPINVLIQIERKTVSISQNPSNCSSSSVMLLKAQQMQIFRTKAIERTATFITMINKTH